MLSDYRQRFAEYHSELTREEYLFRSGRSACRDVAHIFSEYSDLFRLSIVEELRAKLNDVADYRKTERKSIERLIAFALEGNLFARIRELSTEVEEYETASGISWDGQRIPFRQTEELLATESDRQRRRDLHARRADVIKGAQDLLAERFEKLRAGTVELGFESYPAMRSQLRNLDFGKLETAAEKILEKTESRYVAALAPFVMREVGTSLDEATSADLPFLKRYTRFDAFFPRESLLRIYRELCANFGFNADKQSNVELDAASRPGKQLQAFCSPIRIPDEIKLVVSGQSGQWNYRSFFRAAGQAQSAAWTSRNIPSEFQRGADTAVPIAWGMLLENLMLEESWLTTAFGFVESAEFRHALSLLRLLEVRRQAAKLQYELEFHSGKLTGGIGERYAELMTEAVRMHFDEAECFRVINDDFRPANVLRAAAFEAQLRDFLKTQFGSRWWASRRAGEMLIDLWNTGQEYSVEELAAMIGLGELDFECLHIETFAE
ncbi:MAG: hypothetical protein JST85_29715 [Acidobacteria bacterium]|nr:hypothetical protein [Acidobacteriota bacterium]